MRYLHSLHYIRYHTQLAIPTVYDDSLSFYEIMNKTNLHFNHVIDDMNKNYEIIDQAFQEVLEKTNEWMEEAKAQADRAEQEANNSQASAEASQQAAEDARNQANRASSEADRARQEADNAENSAADALEQANRAETEANRAQTEAGNAAASAAEAQKQAEASANSAAQSAASATEAKNQADRAQTEATNAANSAADAKTQADRAQSEAEKSATSAGESAQSAADAKTQADAAANSATQASQSATDAANSAKDAADTLDEAKETFVKKAGDTMSGKLTISAGGLNVTGGLSTDEITDTGKLRVSGLIEGRKGLEISIGSEGGISFQNVSEGLKLSVPIAFTNPSTISNLKTPGSEDQAANKEYVDNINTGVQAQIKDLKDNYLPKNGGTMSGALDMGNNLITNLKDPAADQNAATKKYVDDSIATIEGDISGIESTYLKLSGGTMSGDITMGTDAKVVFGEGHIVGGNNTLLFESFQSLDADGAKIKMVRSPTQLMDAANKEYVDSQTALVKNDIGEQLTEYLAKAGGIMSGSIDMGGKRIVNVGTPSINNDAATKGYVDNAIAGVTPSGDFLPLSGGTMTGNITFNTSGTIGENDFGIGIQTSDRQNNISFIGETLVHNEDELSTSSKPIIYRIEKHTPTSGATVRGYLCSGEGYQNMLFDGFQSVTFAHDVIVKEDLTFNPDLNRPSRIIFNKDKGGMIEHLNTPVADTDAANKAYVDSKVGGNTKSFTYENTMSFTYGNYLNIVKPLYNNYYELEVWHTTTSDKSIVITSNNITGSLDEDIGLSQITSQGFSVLPSTLSYVETQVTGNTRIDLGAIILNTKKLRLLAALTTAKDINFTANFTLSEGFICHALLVKA